MTPEDIGLQLERSASLDNFAETSTKFVESWSSGQVSIDMVEPILKFMEEHPHIELGMPGALVHFMERFSGKGYEDKLVESIKRKPTSTTIWMLNRVINGTRVPEAKQRLIAVMEEAKVNPRTSKDALERADHFLTRLHS